MSREAGASEHWEDIWSSGTLERGTRWDGNGPLPALVDLLKNKALPMGKALVAGCGRGYAPVAFANAGYEALGLDLAKSGVAAAKEYVASLSADDAAGAARLQAPPAEGRLRLEVGNFFEVEETFDVAYDYTFLCALDPSARNKWAAQYAKVVRPGGELVTIIFPMDSREGGPPYALTTELVRELLVPAGFEEISVEPLPDDKVHPGREGKTALGRWRRLALEQ